VAALGGGPSEWARLWPALLRPDAVPSPPLLLLLLLLMLPT